MTPAEFKTVRESLGLSAQWLATHWSVSLRSIRNWEDGTSPIPPNISAELTAIEDYVDDAAERMIEAIESVPQNPQDLAIYEVPRVDADSPDIYPASLHRAIGARIRSALPEVTLEYR